VDAHHEQGEATAETKNFRRQATEAEEMSAQIDRVVELVPRYQVPLTRANYIELAYVGGPVPTGNSSGPSAMSGRAADGRYGSEIVLENVRS